MTSSDRAHTTAPISSSRRRDHCNTLEVAERLRYRSHPRGCTRRRGASAAPTRQRGRRRGLRRGRVEPDAASTTARVPPCVRERAPTGTPRGEPCGSPSGSNGRGVFANAWPPPVNCAARLVPARARPVPFWRHGLARPPETRPRLFVANVPARRASCSARTASCTRCGFELGARRRPPRAARRASRAAVGAEDRRAEGRRHQARTSTIPVLRAGDGALHEQEVVLGVDAVHGEAELRDALPAHPARPS